MAAHREKLRESERSSGHQKPHAAAGGRIPQSTRRKIDLRQLKAKPSEKPITQRHRNRAGRPSRPNISGSEKMRKEQAHF
jgi:hypothetical protein